MGGRNQPEYPIYVIFTGKYQIAKNYGVTGRAARLCGFFNLLVSIGLIGAIIPIRDLIPSLVVQFALIVCVALLAVAIKGNDLKKVESNEESAQSKKQVTKAAVITRAIIAFVGYFLLFILIISAVLTQVLNANEISNIPSIPNVAIRYGTWIIVIIIPAVAAFYLSRRRYRSFDIIVKTR